MKISTHMYNIGQGLKNVWRNKMFSLASIATMTACIFLFGIFYSLGANFQSMVKTAEEGVAVTVFFNEGTSKARIEEIGKEISKRPEVASYDYISAEQAWEDYQKEYFGDNPALAAGFADDNPLANSANYEIYLSDVSMQSTLVSFLEGLDGVRQVNKSEVAAKTLTDINKAITIVSMAIVIILLAVSVFLISNTVMVGISVRREEIAIMKLIGAKDAFVRQPFVVEGIFIGLIGSAIPLILLYFIYGRVIRYAAEEFNFLSKMVTFIPVETIFRTLVPISLILGIGIGWVGSRVTLHKHLRV
ncbi:MAG: permease-like cell division protein FtsX [Pseudobutyrivibrio sp.]|uniref:permease-like cell division protein FtsX n=1 Tax=Pseudobutyrivibrio sp. TaxID=2014367 RepID=UPI001B298625|nr:permease-like cell division protein FtsX [Pseudobutyrivibrio sp.]MBO6282620.1 permease-like cell division protein FtsX [Pseudobutyrivibrio sp.]MBP3261613.1 permease-like cell division protein FtsX [Pseudobutyrivibrio sp.]